MPSDRADGATAPTGPSGWHPDPWQRHHSRFFDGRQWTEHVADGGISSVDSAPVAEMSRSRPTPQQESPPGGDGPRVLEDAEADTGDPGIDHALLLLDLVPDADGARKLRTPIDQSAGQVTICPPTLLTRLGRALVAAPRPTPTALAVLDPVGAERLQVRRPGRRSAPVVDVLGAEGVALGTVTATSVRQGLRATVVDGAGEEIGELEQVGPDTGSLRVVDEDGRTRARLTPVWDVPGLRRHLPPGVVLVDRRESPTGVLADPTVGPLLLGALLAPALLLPAGPAIDG